MKSVEFVCVMVVGPCIWSQIDIIGYEKLIHESVVFIFDCEVGVV